MPQKFSGTPGKQIRRDVRLAIYIRDKFKCMLCGDNLYSEKPEKLVLIKIKQTGTATDGINLITVCKNCSCKSKIRLKVMTLEFVANLIDYATKPLDLALANRILEGRSLAWPNPWNRGYVNTGPIVEERQPSEKVTKRLVGEMDKLF